MDRTNTGKGGAMPKPRLALRARDLPDELRFLPYLALIADQLHTLANDRDYDADEKFHVGLALEHVHACIVLPLIELAQNEADAREEEVSRA